MNKLLTIFVLLIASQSAVLGSLFSARLSSPMHLVAKADGVVDKEQSDADLKKGIAKFYDEVHRFSTFASNNHKNNTAKFSNFISNSPQAFGLMSG